MKITLLLIGKTSYKYIEEGISEYENRIKRYIDFEIKVIKNIKAGKNTSANIFKTKEGEFILKNIKPADTLILLDEKGKMFTSEEFSEFINHKIGTGIKHLVFVIGGAYGFSDDVYGRADGKLSLSKMTFSHQPVRILFTEQLYRAFTIIKGEPYHNE